MKKTLFFLMLIGTISYAQNDNDESEFLLTGLLYEEPIKDIVGHPYFDSSDFQDGSFVYQGRYFSNKSIKYNLCNQKLIIYQEINPQLPRFIQLNSKYLSEFNIGSFKFIAKESILDTIPFTLDFYQSILDEEIKYYIGREKFIKTLAVDNEKDKYKEIDTHFIIYEGNTYPIKRKRDLMKIFGPYKKELRSYIKAKNLKINIKNPEDICHLLRHISTLKN